MMIRVPWKTPGRTTVAAELVDMFRTLVDLAGLDASAVQSDVQGTSLAPLFDDAKALAGKLAYSQIGSCACLEPRAKIFYLADARRGIDSQASSTTAPRAARRSSAARAAVSIRT